MNGPIQKPPPTLADYKAAEARLREAREEAAAGMKASQERGEVSAGDEWVNRLKKEFDNFKAFRDGLPREAILAIYADRILESFSLDKENFVNLAIPADVSDRDAMHALIIRVRETMRLEPIDDPTLEEILAVGEGSSPRARGPRIIKLIGVVPGTKNITRDQQADVLTQKGLIFPQPIEQALAAAAYACERHRGDLFEGRCVRGSVPHYALSITIDYGVLYLRYYQDHFTHDNAASGAPSTELK